MNRFDSQGFFWTDLPKKRGDRSYDRPTPPIPETGWRPPTTFPNLSAAKTISFDTETFDPELTKVKGQPEKGPGWARGSGHIVGFSIGVEQGGRWYFPLRHEIEPEYNLDPQQCLSWAAHVLGDERPKVGANLFYDVGWMRQEGVTVRGPLYDVQYAEALLNSETPSVALDNLAKRYLGIPKNTEFLYEWLSDAYGGAANDKQRKNLYRCTPRLVGPYGESDADLPLRILPEQWKLLERDNLLDLFNMECGLIRLWIDMRFAGCPVDVDYFEKLRSEFMGEMDELATRMRSELGFSVNVNSGADLARAFDHLSIPYGRTAPTERNPEGQPSFTADFLDSVDHPFAEMVRGHRQRGKIVSTFIESYILNSHVNGQVFCQFHPLRGDKNGARSGRLAASTPNLQNIPVRSEEGRRLRAGFIAQRGTCWRKYDYSQIEYRLLAHHAVGQGAEDIRARYNRDPSTDYHEAIIALILQLTGIELERRPAKTINFGLIYGMSQRELIRRLNLSQIEGTGLFKNYHEAVPFAKATMNSCSDFAEKNGYIDTILGRRSRFDRWGPLGFDREAPTYGFERALKEYGNVQRAFTHKALNRRLQGGAADLMKKAMYQCYKDGIFDETGVPRLTVHDELDFIDEGQRSRAFEEMRHVMQTCIPQISVPVVADLEIGPNWGKVKDPYAARKWESDEIEIYRPFLT